jgi:putative peptidoglycan lipid II flippase
MPVAKLFHFFNKEVRGLHEAAYVLALFTLGAQLIALVRDRIFAHSFGVGETLDIFYAAFRIPDALYVLLASLVSIFVLIPYFEKATREGKSAVQEMLSTLFTFFTIVISVLAFVIWCITPTIVHMLYGGFAPHMQTELVSLIRIILLQPIILGVSNLFSAYVQVRGRFLLYSLAPILYNVGIILGVILLYPVLGMAGLGWGVVLGALLHLGIQVPFIVKQGVFPRVRMPDWRQVGEIIRSSIPRTIALSTQQVVLLVLTSMASFIAIGSISSFSFAWNLQAVPLALIGVAYSVAAFPKLAHLYSKGEHTAYAHLIITSARQILFWALLATVLFIVLRAQIVRVLLGTGAFDWNATMMTGAVLALLVSSLIAQGFIILLVRACYAAGNTWTPLVINIVASCATIALAYILTVFARSGVIDLQWFASLMRVPGVPGSELLLLAFAYSFGAFLNAFALVMYFNTRIPLFVSKLAKTATTSVLASCMAGVVTYGILYLTADVFPYTKTLGVLAHGLLAGIGGILTWLSVLVACRSEELAQFHTAIQHRISRQRVTALRGSIEDVR